jgi:hypothetical protein
LAISDDGHGHDQNSSQNESLSHNSDSNKMDSKLLAEEQLQLVPEYNNYNPELHKLVLEQRILVRVQHTQVPELHKLVQVLLQC